MALGRTAKYYRSHPAARKKKAKLDKKINARPEQTKKRTESGRKRREAKRNGQNVKGKDYDHATNRFVSEKTNRGRTGEGARVKGRKVKKKK